MLARVFGLAVVGLVVAAFSFGTAGEKGKGKKGEGKDKDKEPKAKVELKFVTGVIRNADFEKASLTLSLSDGKDRTFAVNESTKFVGPKGGSRGMGKAALKDETVLRGNEVRVGLLSLDDKAALEVYLPAVGTKPAQTTLPPATLQQVEPQFDPGMVRVGPVRRLFHRLFRGGW